MLVISGHQLHQLLDFSHLIPTLEEGFRGQIYVPKRHHHGFGQDANLLLMPAWQTAGYLGIKLITVIPKNRDLGLPSIQGIYALFNAESGEPIAQIDAPVLTNYRTAATSALASQYLSSSTSSSFLMVGTGSLAPYLIRAHMAVRSFDRVMIWGRNPEKADEIAAGMKDEVNLEVVKDLSSAVQQAQLVSVATMAYDPLILGDWIQPGTHLDLVGSFQPSMREVDDSVIAKTRIFVDSLHAVGESGDLVIPIKNHIISRESIMGTLPNLIKGKIKGRISEQEITLYKSVGHASQDLIAAIFAYENYGSHFFQ